MRVFLSLNVTYDTDADTDLATEYFEWMGDYPLTRESFLAFCKDRFVDNYDPKAELEYIFSEVFTESGTL